MARTDFPVCCGQRDTREDPSLLRRSIGRQTDVPGTGQRTTSVLTLGGSDTLIGADYCVATEIEPATLEVGVEVWL